jgi:hypothetical protein
MGFLPSFSAWHFALAGLICAAAPIIIHLLNRRRFRVVHWAAMPFLREALQRNRKMMQIRDIILLVLRTAAVLLFGLALARPFFAVGQEEFDRSKPLHAILVVDNSLSMGYAQVEGTLLDKAKDRAKQFIEELPEGSLVTVLPLCGSEHSISSDPYPYKDKSLTEAIDMIELVDRSASVQRAANEAKKAAEASPELAKRIILFSDQQGLTWRDLTTPEQFKELPSMQVVDVSPAEWENTWVSDLRVQDGLADVETPSTFVVELQHRGTEASARKDVQVSFFVDGELIAEKAVSLDGENSMREVVFEHVFNTVAPAEGQPQYVAVKASISADNLLADNERHLIVPVVASLPVLFVDQYGDDEENPQLQRFGETRHLRTLLAPNSSRDDMQRQLIKVKHRKISDVTQSDLEDARLVIVAGVRSPSSEATVKLLRDYVTQGGQLVIGAGAEFDPRSWNEVAWLDGAGILPLPLESEPVGDLPVDATQLNPLFLSYESLRSHYYFQLGDTSEQQLRDIYSDPLFFKYVEVNSSPETLEKLKAAEITRLEQELAAVAEADRLKADLAKKDAAGEKDDEERKSYNDAEVVLRDYRPTWLRWAMPATSDDLSTDPAQRKKQIETLATATLPQTRARFTSENGPAYLVERRIGRGNVMFVTSGLYSQWNTLPKTDTFFMYDRILRSMIRSTLPERNYTASDRITLPLPSDDRDAEITLKRPGREDDPEPIDPGFIGKEQLGVTVNKPLSRGLYHVTALKPAISADSKATTEEAWDLLFTVNGEGAESDLAPLTRDQFEERAADSEVRLVSAGDTISLAGAQISGQNSWKWLVLLVLLFLLAEIALLAWPMVKVRLDARQDAASTVPQTANIPAR